MEDIRILNQFTENNTSYIIAESISDGSYCPSCGIISKSRHSKYTRKIFNGSLEGVSQEITVVVRKFRCKTQECKQKVFTERLSFAGSYSRFTNNVMDLIKLLALSASAERVSFILSKLGINISHDSIPRILRKLPQETVSIDETVINIGLDDFAFKKSKRYCTLICDMDRRVILDILPSRNKDVVSSWLKKYPHIKLVSRDGSALYGGAISDALPGALQVSDKFHLIKNLLDCISKYIRRKYPRNLEISKYGEEDVGILNATKDIARTEKKFRMREEKIAQKLALIDEIREKNNNGISIRELARVYHMSRNTIKGYVRADSIDNWSEGVVRGSVLDKYRDTIIQMAATNKTQQMILDELFKLGYKGSRSNFYEYMIKNGIRKSSVGGLEKSVITKEVGITIHQSAVVKAICKNTSNLNIYDEKILENLRTSYPELTQLKELIEDIKDIFKGSPLTLEEWKAKAKEININEINSFVTGIERDLPSVKNSIISEYTNGLLEGMVNKVKGIKRTSYGRCKFDLLRTKVLNSQVIIG